MFQPGDFTLKCNDTSVFLRKLDNSNAQQATFSNYNQISLIYLDSSVFTWLSSSCYMYWIKSTNG